MVSAAASGATVDPYEKSLTVSLCHVQEQVRTHHKSSSVWPKDPKSISLFDVLALEPYQKPFRPVRESLHSDRKNGKEAKEALESKSVDWNEAEKILGNEDMPAKEVSDFLRTEVNQSALMEAPDHVIDKLMDWP